ncbi:MAG: class I SAM-dependent methyltransferase [Gammaproteobacteria bacterium]|nr:class I SAM-dependent methyltransferase [Gammaproteobacteria bacterium]MDH5691822.1 class I SAM-dependent methyltransferase [Gammaproteobacteria bacterium]
MIEEKEKIEKISENSLYSSGVMKYSINHCFKVLARYLSAGNILEMGPAEGVMTDKLVEVTENLTVIEGSAKFCDELAKRYSGLKVVNSLFEEFDPKEKYETIVMGHVLEHVAEPVELLKSMKNWLTPSGRIFSAVPNSRSLHRQAAVSMGLLKSEDSLNKLDIHHGHRRVFSPESFRNAFIQSGYSIEVFGGYWLKPLSNTQIEAGWTPEMIKAYMELGERYPDIAGEIYVVAKLS